jgi:hypothetical protein
LTQNEYTTSNDGHTPDVAEGSVLETRRTFIECHKRVEEEEEKGLLSMFMQ